jgi:hypothetical protein
MRKLQMAFLFCLASSIANAAPIERRKVVMCDTVETVFRTVFEEFNEVVVWYAKDLPTPTQYVITASTKDDTWTLIQFDNTQACVLGVGTGSKFPIIGKSV